MGSAKRKKEERLTELAIQALKPKATRYYKHDPGTSGLWLEVFPSGTMAWRYRYRLNGKPEKIAIGKYPEVSLKAARQKRDELAGMVARGASPANEKQLAKVALASATTVREFGERYFKEVVARDRKDPTILRRCLDKDIYPAFGTKSLKDVSALEVQELVFRKRDNGFPAAAAVIRNLVKRLFDYAIVCGVATINPAHATPTRFITKARPRTRALSDPEIKSYLITLYRSNIRRQFKLALHLILLTLIRKSELLFAQWEEIDFESGEWVIPGERTKNSLPHVVYLSNQTEEMFRELKSLAGSSKWVMPSRSGPKKAFAKNALNHALEGINFEIDPFTIHDLRRTASTRLHEMGFSSDVVEKALNHTIGGVRGVYNRAEYREQRKQMLQSWADHISKLVKSDERAQSFEVLSQVAGL